MIRKILAVIGGLVLAVVTFTIIQMIGGMIFGMPNDLDFKDKVAVAAYMATMPFGAFLLLAFGYALGSFLAGIAVRFISKSDGLLLPSIVGSSLTLAWLMNIWTVPHPTWMAVLGFLLYIPFTLIGHRMAKSS